jgi:hypothetical protein
MMLKKLTFLNRNGGEAQWESRVPVADAFRLQDPFQYLIHSLSPSGLSRDAGPLAGFHAIGGASSAAG